jgi:hypothetical protein
VRSAVADRKYLRSAAVETAEAIDMQYAQGLLSGDEAFRQLLTAVRRAEASGRQP